MYLNQIKSSKIILAAILGSLLLLMMLNLLFARLSLKDQRLSLHVSPSEQKYLLPSSTVIAASTLNYRTFASDLIWMKALTYFGYNNMHRQSIEYLPIYAITASELDPYFYSIYTWYPDVYIGAKNPVSEERIEETNQFLDRGMTYFPRDYRLPETAAANYIGYSSGASAARRIRESTRAIHYLQRAAKIPGSSSNVPFLLDYFYGRKAKLEAELASREEENTVLSDSEKEIYLRLYLLAPDPSTHARLEQLLRRYGVDENAAFERTKKYTARINAQHTQRLNYLPVDLWSTIVNPKEFDSATATPNR